MEKQHYFHQLYQFNIVGIKVNEQSRECNNQKSQPRPDSKRKCKRIKINKCTRSIDKRSSPSEVITMLKWTENP